MINNAVKDAWSIVGSEKNNSPVLDFDPETSKFNINSDVEHITKGTKLYFNSRLYELLSSFPANIIEYNGDKNYIIELYNMVIYDMVLYSMVMNSMVMYGMVM